MDTFGFFNAVHITTVGAMTLLGCKCLTKNLNASKPSEHPPSINIRQGGKTLERLGRNIGCNDKIPSWHLIGFPDGSNIGSTEYNVGEKPTVILYTYINRHTCMYVCMYSHHI